MCTIGSSSRCVVDEGGIGRMQLDSSWLDVSLLQSSFARVEVGPSDLGGSKIVAA